MKDNQNKHILSLLVLTSTLLFVLSCAKKEWEGKTYQDQGVTVVENRGPGLWGDEAGDKVEFVEDLSIGVEEGEDHLMFNRYVSIAIDPSLNIYILDRQNQRLLKFDRYGNFIWQTGQKGQGPGEFQYPHDVVFTPSEDIAVRDGSMVHFFTVHGNYMNTVKLKGSFLSLEVLPDGRFLLNTWVRGQLGVAAEYHSRQGRIIRRFPIDYRYGPKLQGGAVSYGGEFNVFDNKIYLSLPGTYEIREYDLDGNILRKIQRDFEIKPPNITFKARGWLAGPSDVSGPCFFTQDKMMVNLLNIVEILSEEDYEAQKFLDFFNKKGQFLGTHPLPEDQSLLAVDSEDFFYFVQSNPYPKISRMKMILY